MPDLTCVVDGEAEDIVFGTNLETIAEDTSPALGMNTNNTEIKNLCISCSIIRSSRFLYTEGFFRFCWKFISS